MDNNEAVMLLLERAKRDGIASAAVSDGHVFVFDRAYLKRIIDANDAEVLTMFVKREVGN